MNYHLHSMTVDAHEGGTRPITCAVVFDGDDTLWLTEALYDTARADAARIVAEAGLDAAAWERLQRRIDVDNVARFGFARQRFPTSCVQAYRDLCQLEQQDPVPAVERRVFAAADMVFVRAPSPHASARRILSELRSRGVKIGLLTKGDPEIQRLRIQQSGLGEMFDAVSIVADKTPESVLAIVELLGAEPGAAWMVGNSERSDILPALAAGLRAIHVDAHVWEHERHPITSADGRILRATSLDEAAQLLTVRGRQA